MSESTNYLQNSEFTNLHPKVDLIFSIRSLKSGFASYFVVLSAIVLGRKPEYFVIHSVYILELNLILLFFEIF